jgi:two-component system, OmpR family, response regulator MprA
MRPVPRAPRTTNVYAKEQHTGTRVLVIDDDERLLKALERGLSLRGFEVRLARDAGQAFSYVQGLWPAVIVLDIMMPMMDGLTFCQLIRQKISVPILMLTARDSVPDRVAGLEAGADDYLVKPFEFDELVARIRALMRRSALFAAADETLTYADIVLDSGLWRATRAGEQLSLTATEFRLLEYFMQHPELTLHREEIIEAVWGEGQLLTESNVLDVHVANLRQKLEANARPRIIQTVRSVGYSLREA